MSEYVQCPECGSPDIAPRGDLCRVAVGLSWWDRIRGKKARYEVHGLVGMCARCRAEVAWGRSGAYKVGKFQRPQLESDVERLTRERETVRLERSANADPDIWPS